jgi:hypothetical protein
MNKEIINLLLRAPDTQIDACIKPLISKWSDPPTPIQVLEVLDNCINGGLASGFVVTLLQEIYQITCKNNDITHDEVIKQAHWRDK